MPIPKDKKYTDDGRAATGTYYTYISNEVSHVPVMVKLYACDSVSMLVKFCHMKCSPGTRFSPFCP